MLGTVWASGGNSRGKGRRCGPGAEFRLGPQAQQEDVFLNAERNQGGPWWCPPWDRVLRCPHNPASFLSGVCSLGSEGAGFACWKMWERCLTSSGPALHAMPASGSLLACPPANGTSSHGGFRAWTCAWEALLALSHSAVPRSVVFAPGAHAVPVQGTLQEEGIVLLSSGFCI